MPELTIQEAAPTTIDLDPIESETEEESTQSVLALDEESSTQASELVNQGNSGDELSVPSNETVVEDFVEPRRLRDIDLDLFENRLKLFRGFDQWDSDQVGRWARVDYLISWRRGTRTPALATTSSAGTAIEDAGVLGLNSTSNLRLVIILI